MKQRRWSISAVLVLAVLSACSRDVEAQKKRLVETGNKYFSTGKYKEASLIYRTAISKDALFGEAYYRLGLSELRAGRLVEAVHALRRASELQPANNDAHSKLADIYMQAYLSDRTKYKSLLSDLRDLRDRLLKLNAKSFEGLRIKGYLELAEGDRKAAIESFRAADQINPGQPGLTLVLAEALFADNQPEEAEARIRAAIQKNKEYFPLYDALYVQKASARKDDEAEKILREKIANNPNASVPILELAGHFVRMKKAVEVKTALDSLLSGAGRFKDAYQQVGDFYFRIGNFTSSQETYEAGIQKTPEQARQIRKKMVELFSIQGKVAEALALADKLTEEDRDDAEARALRAALRLRGGKKEDIANAVKEFEAVLAKLPSNPVIRFNLGEAYAASGQVEKAVSQLSEAIKLRPAYSPPKIALARIALAKSEFARAKTLTEEVIKTQPNLVVPYLLHAASLMGTNDLRAARTELEEVLRKKSDLRDAKYMLAQVNLIDRKLESAAEGFRTLVDAGDMRGVFGLVDVMMAQKREDAATDVLRKELARYQKIDAKSSYVRALRTALAMVAVSGSRFEEAIAQYSELSKEDPSSADIHMRLGDAQSRAKKYQDAYASFEKAKGLAPGSSRPILNMAMALDAMGNKKDTKPLYEQVIKLDPNNALALNNLAFWMVEYNGDLDLALTYAQKAKQLMPQNPDVADTLGWVYLKKNLPDDAIKIFADLVRQRPKHATWRFHLALALVQKGDKLQAKKELQEALRSGLNADEEKKIRDLAAKLG
jgi:tetratricopeptide (TPR) repeat protein